MNETLIKLCSTNIKYCGQLDKCNQLIKSLKTTKENYKSFVNIEINDFYQNVW
jgi:hypothetical protein